MNCHFIFSLCSQTPSSVTSRISPSHFRFAPLTSAMNFIYCSPSRLNRRHEPQSTHTHTHIRSTTQFCIEAQLTNRILSLLLLSLSLTSPSPATTPLWVRLDLIFSLSALSVLRRPLVGLLSISVISSLPLFLSLPSSFPPIVHCFQLFW